jgi:hypothetical protein
VTTKRRMLVPFLVCALVAGLSAVPATAGKKKPKPFKSEAHVLALSHTMLQATTGERNNITLREFENTCAIPTTQGLDAVVWEVPAEYQKISSQVTTGTTATQAWDLYFVMYDKDCQHQFTYGAVGSVTQADATGTMPPGIAYVGIANFGGEPADVWWEAKAL